MEAFANQYNLLTGVQLRFKSKIIQLTGLRDGVCFLVDITFTFANILPRFPP
jgi:hypothetical protein